MGTHINNYISSLFQKQVQDEEVQHLKIELIRERTNAQKLVEEARDLDEQVQLVHKDLKAERIKALELEEQVRCLHNESIREKLISQELGNQVRYLTNKLQREKTHADELVEQVQHLTNNLQIERTHTQDLEGRLNQEITAYLREKALRVDLEKLLEQKTKQWSSEKNHRDLQVNWKDEASNQLEMLRASFQEMQLGQEMLEIEDQRHSDTIQQQHQGNVLECILEDSQQIYSLEANQKKMQDKETEELRMTVPQLTLAESKEEDGQNQNADAQQKDAVSKDKVFNDEISKDEIFREEEDEVFEEIFEDEIFEEEEDGVFEDAYEFLPAVEAEELMKKKKTASQRNKVGLCPDPVHDFPWKSSIVVGLLWVHLWTLYVQKWISEWT